MMKFGLLTAILDGWSFEEVVQIASDMGTRLFDAKIRECVKTKEAQEAHRLLVDYAPKCTTMQDYENFTKELIG